MPTMIGAIVAVFVIVLRGLSRRHVRIGIGGALLSGDRPHDGVGAGERDARVP